MKKKTVNRRREIREIPIGLFFLKYFLYIFAGIVLAVCVLACAFWLFLAKNLIYPASYAEEQARLAVDAIQTAERVTEDLIPALCSYVVFDKDGHVLGGNMEEKDIGHAWNVISGREPKGGSYIGASYYLAVPRGEECCVLRYQVIVQYKSALLRKCLPAPEVLLLIVFILLTFAVILSVAVRFNAVVRQKLSPLADAADMIQRQELAFEIAYGSVKEINAVLAAMDDMRIALKESLESQWRMEQTKNDQMSALAHDLKTPLTLVRGNAELLRETALTGEQEEYRASIENSARQIQDYAELMLEITRAAVPVPADRGRVDVDELFRGIKRQAEGLCAIHQIDLQWNCGVLHEEICADASRLTRAFMNVFANAAEHTPPNGRILFEGRAEGAWLTAAVTDTGAGFTPRALRHGTEQFYMDDESRTSGGAHYGMGLYIVDAVVRQCDGVLILENSSDAQGARVTVKIPLGSKR